MAPRCDDADWTYVPERFRAPLADYLYLGVPPANSFLIAVLTNDLSRAMAHGVNAVEIASLCFFLREFCPSIAWGSGEKIALWEQVGGLDGDRDHQKLQKA